MIRVKVIVNSNYCEIYNSLLQKKILSTSPAKVFFLCFFCNPFSSERKKSLFLYNIFIEKFIPYEIELFNNSIFDKKSLYIAEDKLIFLTVKKEIESILSSQLINNNFELVRARIQKIQRISKSLFIAPSRLFFKSNAILERFLLISIYELLRINKDV